MILDIRTLHARHLEQTHHGHPEVIRWEYTGYRPRAIIDPEFLRWAYSQRTTSGIAHFLGVSRPTVRNALLEYGIVSPGTNPFSEESEEPDGVLEPKIGYTDELPADVHNAATSVRLSSSSGYLSNMSNEDLDSLVQQLRSHYP